MLSARAFRASPLQRGVGFHLRSTGPGQGQVSLSLYVKIALRRNHFVQLHGVFEALLIQQAIGEIEADPVAILSATVLQRSPKALFCNLRLAQLIVAVAERQPGLRILGPIAQRLLKGDLGLAVISAAEESTARLVRLMVQL